MCGDGDVCTYFGYTKLRSDWLASPSVVASYRDIVRRVSHIASQPANTNAGTSHLGPITSPELSHRARPDWNLHYLGTLLPVLMVEVFLQKQSVLVPVYDHQRLKLGGFEVRLLTIHLHWGLWQLG